MVFTILDSKLQYIVVGNEERVVVVVDFRPIDDGVRGIDGVTVQHVGTQRIVMMNWKECYVFELFLAVRSSDVFFPQGNK